MTEDPRTLSWIVGGVLMIVFAWTALSLLVDNLPWKLLDKTRPGQKIFGIALMIVTGAIGLKVCDELLYWVWRGLKHILLLDIEGI
jgi:hypothetical protein